MTTVTLLDSSALLRLCLGEGDLALIEAAMAGTPAVSVLAAVELPCAIAARRHRGALSRQDAAGLQATVRRLLAATAQVGLSLAVREEAVAIAAQHLLRGLDAVHLGTAVVVARQQQRRGNRLRFCTADLRQAEAAVALLGSARVDVVPPYA